MRFCFFFVALMGICGTNYAEQEIIVQGDVCLVEHEWLPLVGFGTYPLQGQTCTKAVEFASKTGYRFIDTATFYDNFEGIADALKKYGRRNFYIISKVWPDCQAPRDLRKDFNQTLERLQISYLDAYLLHWPNSKIPIEKTLLAMEELRQRKKIRHIGLSNVTVHHLRRVLEIGIPITWVQVEMNPYFFDEELLGFCKQRGILVQAWAPLCRGRICNDGLLARIGKKYGKSASQVAIRWIVQHGCMPLPASQNEKHIRENFDVVDFVLTREEMVEIDDRARDGNRQRFYADEFDFSFDQCWPR